MQRQLIGDCAAGAFALRLGDPSATGLAMTALYLLASVLLLAVSLRRPLWAAGERVLWAVTTLAVVGLTLNKQLDLQQALLSAGRCMAEAEGWFDQRRHVQWVFGASVVALTVVAAIWLIRTSRPALASNRLLMAGLVLLALYVLLQVLRFDHMAGLLGQRLAQLHLHRLMEGAGLLLLIWAALLRLRAGQAASGLSGAKPVWPPQP